MVVTADTEIHDAKLELRQSQRMEQGAQSRLMDANEVIISYPDDVYPKVEVLLMLVNLLFLLLAEETIS